MSQRSDDIGKTCLSDRSMDIAEVMNIGRFRISVKAVNVPYVYQKCLANRGDCTPEVKSPRLGFAIIATPRN